MNHRNGESLCTFRSERDSSVEMTITYTLTLTSAK